MTPGDRGMSDDAEIVRIALSLAAYGSWAPEGQRPAQRIAVDALDRLVARLEATEAALRPLAKAYERLRGYDSLTYDLHENTSTESWPVYLTAQELAAALAALDKETQGG